MKISLRRANAIQQTINELVRSIKFNTEISINEFQNVGEEFVKAEKNILETYERAVNLNSALFTIRSLIGAANAKEINNLLTTVALTEKLISLNNVLSTAQKSIDRSVIEGKLSKIRSSSSTDDSSVYRRLMSEVTTGVFDEASIKKFKANGLKLKKEKQKLQDQILELNIKTEIELPESVVETLKAEDLL